MFGGIGDTVEPLNKGHFGDNINSLVLSFVERLSSSRRLYLGSQAVSLVERSIIHCPYLRGSTIGGFTVYTNIDKE